jgi:hypothetical protein
MFEVESLAPVDAVEIVQKREAGPKYVSRKRRTSVEIGEADTSVRQQLFGLGAPRTTEAYTDEP